MDNSNKTSPPPQPPPSLTPPPNLVTDFYVDKNVNSNKTIRNIGNKIEKNEKSNSKSNDQNNQKSTENNPTGDNFAFNRFLTNNLVFDEYEDDQEGWDDDDRLMENFEDGIEKEADLDFACIENELNKLKNFPGQIDLVLENRPNNSNDSPWLINLQKPPPGLGNLGAASKSLAENSNLIESDEKYSTENSNTIKIAEDDILDHRDQLRGEYNEFFDKHECFCDPSQSMFATKHAKLSKSLQRKLVNLHLMMNQASLGGGGGGCGQNEKLSITSKTSYSEIIEKFGNDTNAVFKYSLQNQEFKKKLFRLLRSICERILIEDLTICDQYHNQLQQQHENMLSSQMAASSTNDSSSSSNGSLVGNNASVANPNNPMNKLWAEVRNRGCQFLGPQMQEDVLKLILLALENFTRLSRKVLVLYVVHMLKNNYPKASKTSVGHVVQLLYRAGCFKVEKRQNDASLMELKKDFCKYPALRRQHDAQIIQIALESGIRMSPEQWSQKLFGDSTHRPEMQSIIDKLQSQQTIEKLISDFYEKLNSPGPGIVSTGNSGSGNGGGSAPPNWTEAMIGASFMQVKPDLEYLASINFEKKVPPQIISSEDLDSDGLTKRNSIASSKIFIF